MNARTDEKVIDAEIISFNPNAVTVVAYSQTEQDLQELEAKYAQAVFNCDTKEGLEEANEALKVVKKCRTTLEKVRKSTKDPVLAYGKLIDSEAKKIESRILALETPLQTQVDEAKRKAELARQAAEKAAAERLAEFDRMIDAIRSKVAQAFGKTSTEIQALIDGMTLPHIGLFFEKTEQAEAAHWETLAKLETMRDAAKQHEADQAELAELRRQQAELKAAQDKIAAEKAELEKQQAAPVVEPVIEPTAAAVVEKEAAQVAEAESKVGLPTRAQYQAAIAELVEAVNAALQESPDLKCAWMLRDAVEGANGLQS